MPAFVVVVVKDYPSEYHDSDGPSPGTSPAYNSSLRSTIFVTFSHNA